MARIKIFNQSRKETGIIKIRFRLTAGRGVQLYHKSEIEADLSDLSKFEADGTPKKRANYNRTLHKAINSRMALMQSIYEEAVKDGRGLNNESFEMEIDKHLHPEKYYQEEEAEEINLLSRFHKHIEEGLFSDARKAAYWVTYRIMERYLSIIDRVNISIDEVTPEFIVNFRNFIINEWEYAKKKKYSYLYKDMRRQDFPDSPRTQNTTATKLKHLQAFFRVLEDADVIVKSPFRKMGRENRLAALREQYGDPISLSAEEIRAIIDTDVKKSLQGAKDAFLIQCALGCRISDFQRMGMDNIAVTEKGVPYIHYLPRKTMHLNKRKEEVKTPLLRFAFDIIQRTGFNLPILRNVTGRDGFNKKIKEILEVCGINREVGVYNEEKKMMEYLPLYTNGSTKLCRKSFVDITTKVQVNRYAAGLHKAGSDAVDHYSKLDLSDLNILMCEAFGERPYQVDKELNIIP